MAGTNLRAQVSLKDSAVTLPIVHGTIGFHAPAADLAKRFGLAGVTGGGFTLKTRKGILLGIEFLYQFGNRIHENSMLDHLLSDGGFVISREGLAMDVFLHQRGLLLFPKVGYMFPVLRRNPNSGPFVTAGAGFWQHRIRIEEKYGTTPSLADPYLAGYDRLTSGLMISQMLGYQVLSNKRLVSFFIGVEAVQGFLKGRRDINFDTGQPGTGSRFDMAFGMRFGWSIPIYRRNDNRAYYF